MQNTWKMTLMGAALAAMMLPAAAQSTTPTPASPAPTPNKTSDKLADQKTNQQDRIAQGVQSGQLTPAETGKLEQKEGDLQKEVSKMRAADGGHLTAADKAKVEQQQQALSKGIYTQKHDAQSAGTTPGSEVGKREENQQDRIAQGIKSGQLTPGEASHLEQNDARINREVRNDRGANGGSLTQAQRRQVNQQENRNSHQIYRAKHNGRRY